MKNEKRNHVSLLNRIGLISIYLISLTVIFLQLRSII